jgi:hypothetical protein
MAQATETTTPEAESVATEDPTDEEVRAALPASQRLVLKTQSVVMWAVLTIVFLVGAGVLLGVGEGTAAGGWTYVYGYLFVVCSFYCLVRVGANLGKDRYIQILDAFGLTPSTTLPEIEKKVVEESDSEGLR